MRDRITRSHDATQCFRAPQRRILVAILLTLAIVSFYVVLREPTYEERRLSDWLEEFDCDNTSPEAALRAWLDREVRLHSLGWGLHDTSTSSLSAPGQSWNARVIRVAPLAPSTTSPLPSTDQSKTVYNRVEETRVDSARRAKAEEAMRSLGAKALPHLIRTLSSSEPRAKEWLRDWLRKQTFLKIYLSNSSRDRARAERAIKCLGRTAVPALLRLLEHHDRNRRRLAIRILVELGAEARAALPALGKASQQDHDTGIRLLAAAASHTIESAVDMTSISKTELLSNRRLMW